ncbi:MAG: TVP38/TMEM64 family protein [Thermoanaerobaculia bacterium]
MSVDSPQLGSTRSAVIRASILALVLLSAFAAARWTPLADWLQRDVLVERLNAYRESPWSAPSLVGLLVVFGVVGLPVSPLIFSGAALFGPIFGWLYNLIGCILGSAASYGTGRWLGGELIRRLVGQERLAAMTRVWDRHGFWTVFRLRFLPLPFPFVNYGAALAGIEFGTYFVASALGMALSVGVWTYLFYTLFEATSGDYGGVIVKGFLALGGLLAISFLPRLIRRREKATEPSRR